MAFVEPPVGENLAWQGSTRLIRRTTLSPMAMGKRRRHTKQTSMWVATEDLPRSAAHPFSTRLNQILDQHDSTGASKDPASDSTPTRSADQRYRRGGTSAC